MPFITEGLRQIMTKTPSPRSDVACVVLSGGASSRFGGDKLLAKVDGVPAISRVVGEAAKVSSNVFVSVATEKRGKSLLNVLGEGCRYVVDAQGLDCHGPAVAIFSAITRVKAPCVLFIPGDIPWLEAAALQKLLPFFDDSKADIVSLYWPDGMTENLIQLHRRESVLSDLKRAVRLRAGATRASSFLRAARRTLFVSAGQVTNNPICFSNINRRADLLHPKPRGLLQAGLPNLTVRGGPKLLFWRGSQAYASSGYQEAALCFGRESEDYANLGLAAMAAHCRLDKEEAVERTREAPGGRGYAGPSG